MNILQTYRDLPSSLKIAFGGGIGAAIIYTAAATNPVTLIGLTALGQIAAWLPDSLQRCAKQRPPVAPEEQPAVIPFEDQIALATALSLSDEKYPFNQIDQEDRDLNLAIQASLNSHRIEHAQSYLPELSPYSCSIKAALSGEEDRIPYCFLIQCSDGQHYNAAEFLYSLLSQESYKKDVFRKDTHLTLRLATDLAGIDLEDFKNIWAIATAMHPNGGMTEEEATQAREARTDFRYKQFFQMLQIKNPEYSMKRERFIEYYLLEYPEYLQKYLPSFQRSYTAL